jgi:hypothetical protein
MDARFVEGFVADAKRAGKLPHNYRVPDLTRDNTPERMTEKLRPWRERGMFAELPFGTDLTPEEVVLSKALRRLAKMSETPTGKLRLLWEAARADTANPSLRPYLQRMALAEPRNHAEGWQQRLVAVALQQGL